MERHCQNALAVAQHLAEHPAVAWVTYPGLPDHPSHGNAKKYLTRRIWRRGRSLASGGLEAGVRMIDRSVLWSHLANVGDAKSLIIHPASTTHQQLSPSEQEAAGVSPDLIRLSVGIEGVEDLIAELDDALYAATGLGLRESRSLTARA